MQYSPYFVTAITFVFALLLRPSLGEEEQSEAVVNKVEMDGHFEAIKSVVVEFSTKQLAEAKVKKVVAAGSLVQKGDFLISFEREQFTERLKEAERKMQNSEVSNSESEFAHSQFLESQRLDKQAAERAWAAAQDAYQGYQEFDRQYAIDSAKFSLQQSLNSLEYLEEDLRQLERMYQEDELTEESEELVLTRARRAVESAKFRLRSTEVRTERTLKQTLPREMKSQKEKYRRAELAYEKAMADLKFAMQKRKLARVEAAIKFDEEQEKLEELRADGGKLVINAPAKGLVFYGELNRGKLADKPLQLEAGTTVKKDQPLFTIASPKGLRIRCSVAERDVAKLKVGMRGLAKPTADPKQPIDVSIESISRLPFTKGNYDCVVSIHGKTTDLLPSMTCKLEFEWKPESTH